MSVPTYRDHARRALQKLVKALRHTLLALWSTLTISIKVYQINTATLSHTNPSQPSTPKTSDANANPPNKPTFLTLPREVRNHIYSHVAADLDGENPHGKIDTAIFASQMSALSHVNTQVRDEWHEAYYRETILGISLDTYIDGLPVVRCPYAWVSLFGDRHLRRMWTIDFSTDKFEVTVALQAHSYDVEVRPLEIRTRCRWRGVSWHSSLGEEERLGWEQDVFWVLETGLVPDEVDGTFYMDRRTLFRLMKGFDHGFDSPEYEYLCEQPCGLRERLPKTWERHYGAVHQKINATWNLLSQEEESMLLWHGNVDMEEKIKLGFYWPFRRLDAILASMEEAGGEDREPLPLQTPERTIEMDTFLERVKEAVRGDGNYAPWKWPYTTYRNSSDNEGW